MNATNETLAIQRLRRIEDQLSDLSSILHDEEDPTPTSPSASLKRAANLVEDAVTELMTTAAKQYGREVIPGSIRTLREPVRI